MSRYFSPPDSGGLRRTPPEYVGECKVLLIWEADWSRAASPFYLLLSDIFRDKVPDVYGQNDRMSVDTAFWRDGILGDCQ